MLTLDLVLARAHGCSSSRVRAHTHQQAYFPKNMRHRNYQVVAWLRMDRAWSTMGALHRPPLSQDRTRTRPHPHTHRIRTAYRIRTAIDIDLRKSFQTEMISPPFDPRLFSSLVFSVRMTQFRGIFAVKMRLVRLFPDACNGDVTHYTTFWSVRGAILARSAAETRFARLRSG